MNNQKRVSIPDLPIYFFCGCCKAVLGDVSEGTECRVCGEHLCEPTGSCLALCRCDRTHWGKVKQLWFRKSNEVYATLMGYRKVA